MRRDGWIVLLGIGLLSPTPVEAEHPERRAEPFYRTVANGVTTCRAANRRVRMDCYGRLDPIHVPRGRVRTVSTRRTWIPVAWGELALRPSFTRDRFEWISQGSLNRMIGRDAVRRIRSIGRRAGLRGALRGHWFVGPRRGAVLVLSMGGRDIAQLADHDRDGWVDTVQLRSGLHRRPTYAFR